MASFPGQERPLAEYARQLIGRFDFEVRVDDFGAEADPAARRPGIIMIDPAFIAEGAGRAALRAIADTLPRWVLPLVVVAPDDEPTRHSRPGSSIYCQGQGAADRTVGKAAHGVNRWTISFPLSRC